MLKAWHWGALGAGLVLAMVLLLPRANDRTPWQLIDVTEHLPPLRFALIDDRGEPMTATDTRGKVVLLYFGYTGCGEQCPATLTRLKNLLAGMGTRASQVRVLFVTVNPATDTAPILHRYLALYHSPSMVGLTGNAQDIATLARRYRAVYRPDISGSDAPHSNVIYIFDARGDARLLATPDVGDAALHDDIARLLDER